MASGKVHRTPHVVWDLTANYVTGIRNATNYDDVITVTLCVTVDVIEIHVSILTGGKSSKRSEMNLQKITGPNP